MDTTINLSSNFLKVLFVLVVFQHPENLMVLLLCLLCNFIKLLE